MFHASLVTFLFVPLTGVCNTDNFSLLSITIDYGPFGFMDDYDPGKVGMKQGWQHSAVEPPQVATREDVSW